jgi:4-hydroxy-tetrahydrodipicolinate reductase
MVTRIGLGGASGRMGQTIQECAEGRETISIELLFDPDGGEHPSLPSYDGQLDDRIDVYIDFTTPDSIMDNVRTAIKHGIPTVIGTTGWYDSRDEIRRMAETHGVPVLFASNFSTGTNACFEAVRLLARILGEAGFDASVVEKHHTGKVDAPSGTAETYGDILVDELPGKDRQTHVRQDERHEDEIDVVGVRVGDVPGEHEITFTSQGHTEKITLRHEAYGTQVFGDGALDAAVWLHEEQPAPGLYNFREDVLSRDSH